MSQNLTVTSAVDANNNLSFHDRDDATKINMILKAGGATDLPSGAQQNVLSGGTFDVKSGGTVQYESGAVVNDLGATMNFKGVSLSAKRVFVLDGNATIAQINTGTTILADAAGVTLTPLSVWLRINGGSLGGATDIRLSDTNNSPVDIFTVDAAHATIAAIVTDAGGTGITLGAGFLAALTAGKGIQIRKTGSTGTTTTSVDYRVLYRMA